tara:strand:+ start:81076 stop:81651 length:576 start_codon:yes stop_codon:yes gene_type:complete
MIETEVLSNKILMERIKDSDPKAFGLLYDRLWEQMYVKAYVILGNKNLAKDVVQEVWISFWERCSDIENENVEGYLMNAVRYKVYNQFRNLKNQTALMDDFSKYMKALKYNNVEDVINLDDTEKILNKTIDNLPNKCREVFKLSRYKGLKNNEIATELNISQRTVETHISNALKVLRRNVALSFVLMSSFF